jgi:hypothetical protein
MYVDGDIPRETYFCLNGPGWAHYRARLAGFCAGCNKPTNYWIVSIKENGKYWCVACEEAEQKTRKSNKEHFQNYMKNSLNEF